MSNGVESCAVALGRPVRVVSGISAGCVIMGEGEFLGLLVGFSGAFVE